VRAAGKRDLSSGEYPGVCDNTVDDRVGECVVRGAVESGWMRILPERSDDHLSGI
jgi:hypothetical protein